MNAMQQVVGWIFGIQKYLLGDFHKQSLRGDLVKRQQIDQQFVVARISQLARRGVHREPHLRWQSGQESDGFLQ